jgi:hypothetical protein
VQPLLQSKRNQDYIFWVCVCSVWNPACNAHAPYCHLWPVWLYYNFTHYLITGTIFEEQLLNTKCAFWFSVQPLSEKFLILRRTGRDVIENVCRSAACEVLPVLLVRFSWNLNFLYTFSQITRIPHFMKNRPVGAALLHVDGRTHMTKLIVAFRNFVNAPKN